MTTDSPDDSERNAANGASAGWLDELNAAASLNPVAQSQFMLAAAVSQLSAAIWGLAEVIREHGATSELIRVPIGQTRVVKPAKGLPSMARPTDAGGAEALNTANAQRQGEQEAGAAASADTGTAVRAQGAPTYPDVQRAIQSVAHDVRLGRSRALAILQSFGVDHGEALKPDQYGAVVDKCRAALAQAH